MGRLEIQQVHKTNKKKKKKYQKFPNCKLSNIFLSATKWVHLCRRCNINHDVIRSWCVHCFVRRDNRSTKNEDHRLQGLYRSIALTSEIQEDKMTEYSDDSWVQRIVPWEGLASKQTSVKIRHRWSNTNFADRDSAIMRSVSLDMVTLRCVRRFVFTLLIHLKRALAIYHINPKLLWLRLKIFSS